LFGFIFVGSLSNVLRIYLFFERKKRENERVINSRSGLIVTKQHTGNKEHTSDGEASFGPNEKFGVA